MVIETEEKSLFDRFVQKRMETLAPHLIGPAPEDGVEVDADRERFRVESRAIWNGRLAAGYTPAELAGIDPWPGERNGRPVRPLPPTVLAEQETQASRLYKLLAQRNLLDHVPPTLAIHLEYAYGRRYAGTPEALAHAMTAGQAAIDAQSREQQQRAVAEAETVLVDVLAPCGFGLKWPIGRHRWSPEELREAEAHHKAVHDNAGGRSLGSIGHKRCPPWQLVVGAA